MAGIRSIFRFEAMMSRIGKEQSTRSEGLDAPSRTASSPPRLRALLSPDKSMGFAGLERPFGRVPA